MRQEKIPAIVIHSRDYRETSQLVDIFTSQFGRVKLVTRGSRSLGKGQRRLAPFSLYLCSWTGRGELKTLTGCETQLHWSLPAAAGVCGLYLNELLWHLLQTEDSHPDLFSAYLEAMTLLSEQPSQAANCLRRFEISLLEETGYGLNFDADRNGELIDDDMSYRFDVGEGWVMETPSEYTLTGRGLSALQQGIIPQDADGLALKRLLRRLLDQVLGGKNLHSRDLIRQYGATG